LALKRRAAAGVDGVTWDEYGQNLEARLADLHARVHRGAYQAKPSRRVYIPKPDGRQRPLGIAALEDKVLQRAVVEVLNAIYEVDFLGFSYGFRPGRSQHHALDAIGTATGRKKVNWVLDADIRGFFDNLDHEWLMKFVEHRIADRRILRLIRKWLRAGVTEDGKWTETVKGTPQGAVVSPLLANVYLHYVFDLWVEQWRKKNASGDVIVVRYADDFVMGFQHRHEAERFLKDLQERMAKFGLELHSDKTRLIEFGRFAAQKRERRGEGKPETFNFLGFTHYGGKSFKNKRYIVKRQTMAKRLRAKLKDVKEALMRRRHEPLVQLGRWLAGVIRGWFNYHAVPDNRERLETFRTEAVRMLYRALKRRSQRCKLTWKTFGMLADALLPKVQIKHPYPNERFNAITRGKSRVR
jgi:group II intron reverse transcriptase/maturase